jgi:F-type H+-transporting ATPase subunit delta
MNISLVANRYANALFLLALEKNLVEEVYRDNLLISKTCAGNKDLVLLLKSPVVNTEKKQKVLTEPAFHDLPADHGA